MAKFNFKATHGVHLSEDGETAWAHFKLDPEAEPREGRFQNTYRFATDDAKVAERVRKVEGYGIEEVKDAKEAPASKE